MSSPLISVVIATRNRTDLLARALDCIAGQQDVDFEVIVADDGSSPDVLTHHRRLLADLGPRFVLLHRGTASGTGPAATRNRGSQAAKGAFVAFLDDDDQWASPSYLAYAVAALQRHDGEYAFGHLEGVRNGILQNPGWVPPATLWARERVASTDPVVYTLSARALRKIGRSYLVHPSSTVVKRQTLMDAGGFFERIWSYGEDINLMLRILDRADRVLYVPEMVTHYRLPTGDSVSLQDDERMHALQLLLAAQDVRLRSTRTWVRASARSREAWTYRCLARTALTNGDRSEACAFASQSVVTRPTLGGIRSWASVMLSSAFKSR